MTEKKKRKPGRPKGVKSRAGTPTEANDDPQAGTEYRKRRGQALTPQHEMVVNEYFRRNLSQMEAMLAAGYAESTARTRASDIFGRPDVQREIQRRMRRRAAAYNLDEDWVIQRLMRIAAANPGEILQVLKDNDYDLSILNEEESYAIRGLTVDERVDRNGDKITKYKFSFVTQLEALNLLCRRLGLLQDKVKLDADASLVELLQAGRKRASMKVED